MELVICMEPVFSYLTILSTQESTALKLLVLLVHSLYFALINVSLKLEICVEASYLLLLILLEIIQDGILDQCQCLRLTDKRYLLS